MIWRVRKPGAKKRAEKQWHWWFAWYPVRIPTKGRMSNQHRVWCCKIKRKGRYEYGYECAYWNWFYAIPGHEYNIRKKK